MTNPCLSLQMHFLLHSFLHTWSSYIDLLLFFRHFNFVLNYFLSIDTVLSSPSSLGCPFSFEFQEVFLDLHVPLPLSLSSVFFIAPNWCYYRNKAVEALRDFGLIWIPLRTFRNLIWRMEGWLSSLSALSTILSRIGHHALFGWRGRKVKVEAAP